MNEMRFGGLVIGPATINLFGTIIPTHSVASVRGGVLRESTETRGFAATIIGGSLFVGVGLVMWGNFAGDRLYRTDRAMGEALPTIATLIALAVVGVAIWLGVRESRRFRESLVILITVASGQMFRIEFQDRRSLDEAMRLFESMVGQPNVVYNVAVLNNPTLTRR